MTSPSARAALERLLLALFQGTELRRYSATLADDENVEDELPEGARRADLAHALVKAMDSRGLIDNAFFSRLTALRKMRADDISRVATLWTKPPPIGLGSVSACPKGVHNLPLQALEFIGREDELARIHALVASDKAVAISQPTSVSGLGGIGKTQLALRFAILHADEFDAVLWVDAAGDDITPAFADLEEVLRLSRSPDAKVVDRARVVREALETGGPKLLVLDNVDHFKAIKPHLPRRGPTRVLMTTRLPDLPGAKTLPLDVLPPEEALRVLLGDREVTEPELTAARDLCAELEYLTLALAVAREVLRSGLRTHCDLLDEVRQTGPVPWSDGIDPEVEDALGKHPSLVRLFDASVALLAPKTPKGRGAVAMLEVGGWFAPAPIELMLLMEATRRQAGEADVPGAHILAEALAKVGLATCASGQVIFHRLVGAYARARAGLSARGAMLETLAAVCEQTGQDTLGALRLAVHRAHFEAASSLLTAEDPADFNTIPHRWMLCCWHLGEFEPSRRLGITTLKVVSDERWRARLMMEVGNACESLGDYAKALSYYQRSLAIDEKTLGTEHPDTAITLNAIGQGLARQGKYAEALSYYQRSLAIKENTFGTQHPDTAATLNGIGQTLAQQGKYAEALGYHERALAIMGNTLGKEHPSTATILNAIGQILARQGKYAEALGYYHRDLAITEKTLGTEHPDTAISLDNIGQALAGQGNHATAFGYFERALAIKKKTIGAEHPDTAITYATFAQLRRDTGDIPEARRLYAKALAVLDRSLGPEHPTTRAVRGDAKKLKR